MIALFFKDLLVEVLKDRVASDLQNANLLELLALLIRLLCENIVQVVFTITMIYIAYRMYRYVSRPSRDEEIRQKLVQCSAYIERVSTNEQIFIWQIEDTNILEYFQYIKKHLDVIVDYGCIDLLGRHQTWYDVKNKKWLIDNNIDGPAYLPRLRIISNAIILQVYSQPNWRNLEAFLRLKIFSEDLIKKYHFEPAWIKEQVQAAGISI